jgi:hypothetical protein
MKVRGNKKSFSLANTGRSNPYSKCDIATIIAATGIEISSERTEELMDRLGQAAERLKLQTIIHNEPTAKMLQKKFSRIEKAADSLLNELGAGPADSTRSIPKSILDGFQLAAIRRAAPLGKSGISLLQESIGGVVQLKRWSRKLSGIAAEQERKRREDSGQKDPRRSKTWPFRYWINDLSRIYQDIWEREPRLNWNDHAQEYTGGFFKFVRASSVVLGVNMADDALAMNIRRAKKS